MNTAMKLSAADASKSTLYSFDLFDTLIERETVEPESIFWFMQRELARDPRSLPDSLCAEWAMLRKRAEADARAVKKRLAFLTEETRIEVTLDDIYQRIADSYDVGPDGIRVLQQMEIDAELAHCKAIPARIDYLCGLREQGHSVVIITDTYLPRITIAALIRKAAPQLTEVPVFISSEIGCQKSTGEMYKYIYSRLGRGCRRWIHYGDNDFADGRVPRAFGIEGTVHAIAPFLELERRFIRAATDDQKYDAYRIASMIRTYRLALLDSTSSRELAQRYYGYAYVGSALAPYVYWCVQQALKQDLQTLYFIARDGYIMKAIADDIIATRQLPLRTKYIYGSRATWRVAAFPEGSIDPEFFGPYGNFYAVRTFADLVRASLLSEEELLQVCPQARRLRGCDKLAREAVERIIDALQASQAYRELIQQLAVARRPLAVQYLRQEIDCNERHAFVEFWGTGYTQESFTRLLNEAAGRDIGSHFYYVRSFYGSHGNVVRTNFLVLNLSYAFFEAIFSDINYHSIKNYFEDENGIVQPVINRKGSVSFECFLDGARQFVKDLMDRVDLPDKLLRFLSTSSFLYQSVRCDDPFICTVFGELEFDLSGYDRAKKIAPPFTKEIIDRISTRGDFAVETLSVPISYARSPEAVRKSYDQKAAKLDWMDLHGMRMGEVFPPHEPANTVRPAAVPLEVATLVDLPVYSSVEFSDETRTSGTVIAAGTHIEVSVIEHAADGSARLLTQLGYIAGDSGSVYRVDTPPSGKDRESHTHDIVMPDQAIPSQARA